MEHGTSTVIFIIQSNKATYVQFLSMDCKNKSCIRHCFSLMRVNI